MSCRSIIYRELKAAAFRPPLYYLRGMVGLTASVTALGTMLGEFYQRVIPGSAGTRCLELFGLIGGVFVTLAGVWATSNSLISERRENTLGLLFLTDLRAFDILLGKMAAGVIRGFWALLAASPALCLTFLLGGVRLPQVFQLGLSLGNMLFFSSALGMLGAVLIRDDRRAASLAMLLAVTWLLLLPAVIGSSLALGGVPYWQKVLLALLPTTAVALTFAPISVFGGSTTGPFLLVLAASHALGWGILALAARALRHYQRELEPEKPFRPRWACFRVGPRRKVRRWWDSAAAVENDPTLRLAEFQYPTRFYVWIGFGLVFCVGCFLLLGLDTGDEGRWVIILSASWVLHAVIKYETAGCACRIASDAATSGVLPLLLLTPVTPDQVTRGYLVAVKRQIWPPMALGMAVQCGWLIMGFCFHSKPSQFNPLVMPLTALACLGLNVILVADLYTLVWHGYWAGVSTGNYALAMRQTVTRVLFSPWLVFLGTVVLWRAVSMQSPSLGALGAAPTLCWLVALMTMSDLYWCAWAMHQTRDQLRPTVVGVP